MSPGCFTLGIARALLLRRWLERLQDVHLGHEMNQRDISILNKVKEAVSIAATAKQWGPTFDGALTNPTDIKELSAKVDDMWSALFSTTQWMIP